MPNQRETLDRLIRERGDDYASLSRLLNRNAAYIQQFIKRGSPRKLDEDDRRTLSRYFGIDESVLGATAVAPVADTGLALVPRFKIGASAGPGSVVEDQHATGQIAFDPVWLRGMGLRAGNLSMIQVDGDSMRPALNDGDEILVDRNIRTDKLRNGIYVLRMDDTLIVKRIALTHNGNGISVRSDNKAYPSIEECDPSSISIVGRVVWVGRRL